MHWCKRNIHELCSTDIWGEGDEEFGYQTAAVELCRALGEVEGEGRDAPES